MDPNDLFPSLETQLKQCGKQLAASGLPVPVTRRWISGCERRLGRRVHPGAPEAAPAIAAVYAELTGCDYLERHRRRLEKLVRIDEYYERDEAISRLMPAVLSMLERLARGALGGRTFGAAYRDRTFRNCFTDVGRGINGHAGGYSREDWFTRSKARSALFDHQPDLLWLADKVTRQLYRPPLRGDFERAHPFPLDAWADELGVSATEVLAMIEGLIERIATCCPAEYEANLAPPLQRLKEFARPPGRSLE